MQPADKAEPTQFDWRGTVPTYSQSISSLLYREFIMSLRHRKISMRQFGSFRRNIDGFWPIGAMSATAVIFAKFVDSAVAAWGRLDIIIANAGICIPEVWSDVTPKSFQDHLDINVTGVWNTVMAGAHHIIAGGKGGSVVLTSSYAGKKVQPFMVHYTTSKHAVTGMTRAFAAELGRYDIRVNSIHPGAVGTAMGSGEMATQISRIYAQYPRLASMGTSFIDPPRTSPEEVAACVAFLVSDAARFITAEHLSIDGGAQYF